MQSDISYERMQFRIESVKRNARNVTDWEVVLLPKGILDWVGFEPVKGAAVG